MTQWYVKELSQITKTSVQTLHHYDRIDLLKPSVRLANGYRLYSEKDLLKLQQIIALKFFGFELAQIKNLLNQDENMIDHFLMQSQFLKEKANALLAANTTLKKIISDCRRDKSIPWETIIQTIEVYRMTQELEKSWAGKALTPDELKQYANFNRDLETKFTTAEKEESEKNWQGIVKDINANLKNDPASEIGIAIGKRCMDFVNNMYTVEYRELRNVIWEKGFKAGHAAENHQLTPEAVIWLENANKAYYGTRIYGILSQIDSKPHDTVIKQWEALMAEMYGNNQARRKDFYGVLEKDPRTSAVIKAWLKKNGF